MSVVCFLFFKVHKRSEGWVFCACKEGLISDHHTGQSAVLKSKRKKNRTTVSMDPENELDKIQPILVPALRTGEGFVFSLSLILDICIDL